MSKTEELYLMLEQNNGYLFTSEVEKRDISRTYLARFVKENHLEKVAKGIYISEETWEDELYILQKLYSDIIISGETALYLHGLLDREYNEITISVKPSFSGSRLREKGVIIRREKDPLFGLGATEIETNLGNKVAVYDKERCICDLVKNRKKIEVQNYQTAIKTYMRDSNKDLSKLITYAEVLNVRDEVMKYIEVLV